MQDSSSVNSDFRINIDQLVKHVVEDFCREDGRPLVLPENGISTSTNAVSININAGTSTNAEQPSNEVPPTVPVDDDDDDDDDDIVFLKSVEAKNKPKRDDASGDRKRRSVIKIEIVAKRTLREVKRKPPIDEVPCIVPSDEDEDDDVVFISSEKSDKSRTGNASHDKEGDSENDVKILAENSIWDIKRKVTMQKYNDSSLDVVVLDDMSPPGSLEQSNTPVQLMTYSQSSNNASVSKRKIVTPGKENLDTIMEVDIYDDSCSSAEETVSVGSFEFSDDENEEGETIEHFLFKASLILKKIKHRNESEIQGPKDLGLLNITGSIQNEETDDVKAKSFCFDDDTNEYYNDGCFIDAGDQKNKCCN